MDIINNAVIAGWEDEEYKEFVDKFKAKKTTDDCYTPPIVYDAVADWVASEYGLDKSNFVRPFYPGGDYQRFSYAAGSVVVDNPPFSILTKIVKFYEQTKQRFFLFAPTLTLFGGGKIRKAAALPVGVQITFENGAKVNTSFITNLEPEGIQVRTVPKLYQAVKAANDENTEQTTKKLPKYEYPPEILTAASAYQLSKNGVELIIQRQDCCGIGTMDAQRKQGITIFGGGLLLSSFAAAEKAAAEKAAAEKAAAEKAAALVWQLSEREKQLIRYLDNHRRRAHED